MSRFLKRSSLARWMQPVRSDADVDVNEDATSHGAGGALRRGAATLAVAALALVGACEADEDGPQMDLGMIDEADGGFKALEPLRVGSACSEGIECGAGGECLHVSSTSTTYPGGYCTAECGRSFECGPGAECPVNEAVAVDPTFKPSSWWPRNCFQSCTPGATNACRPGYECRSLAKSYGVEAKAPEPMKRTVCLPVPTWRPASIAP